MTKNILLVMAAAGLLLIISCSQNDIAPIEEVIQKSTPEAVIQSFQGNFPEAQAPRWSTSNELYRANFINQGIVSGATFEESGNMLTDWHMMEEVQVPQAVNDYMKINYLGAKIIERHKINFHDETNKGTVNYRLLIKYLDIIHTLDFKADGTLISAISAGKENERHSCND